MKFEVNQRGDSKHENTDNTWATAPSLVRHSVANFNCFADCRRYKNLANFIALASYHWLFHIFISYYSWRIGCWIEFWLFYTMKQANVLIKKKEKKS